MTIVCYNTSHFYPGDTVQGPFASQEIINHNIGPFVIGRTFCLILFGLASGQVYDYLVSPQFKADSRRLKTLVCLAYAFLLLQAIDEFGNLYFWSTIQKRAIEDLSVKTYWQALSFFPLAFVSAIVQGFFLNRAKNLIQKRTIKILYVIIVGMGITLSFTGNLIATATSLMQMHGYKIPKGIKTADGTGGITFTAACVVDLILSVTLVYLLRELKKTSNKSPQTGNVLLALSKVAVQSAAYTTITAVIAAILTYSMPNTYYFHIFASPLPPLYMIALISSLNAREKIRVLATTIGTGNTDNTNKKLTLGVSFGSGNGQLYSQGLESGITAPMDQMTPRPDEEKEVGGFYN